MTSQGRDPVVARALQQVRAPEPDASFWAALEGRLVAAALEAEPPAADGVGGADDGEGTAHVPLASMEARRSRSPRPAGRLLAVAAVLLMVVAGAGLIVARRDAGVSVGTPADTGSPPASTSPTLSSPAGADDAVLAFLDALGRGDVDGAAARLGPMSERYLEESTGSVTDFLRPATEGLGAWSASKDRTAKVVEVRTGDVVVVVSGHVTVEGNVEERTTAFPAHYSAAKDTWLVEPWAFDPSTGGRLDVARPTSTAVAITAPVGGTLWVLAADGRTPAGWPGAQQAPPRATTEVDLGCCPGRYAVVIVLINDSTFSALATTLVVG